MDYKNNEICGTCENGPYHSCEATADQITFDDITRKVVDCDLYKAKAKHHIKITYELEDRSVTFEQDVYDLPVLPEGVKWKKKKPKGLGEFENVFISDEELAKLKRDYPQDYATEIEALSEYLSISNKGKKYKSHYAVVRKWCREKIKDRQYKEQQALEREKRRENKDRLKTKPTYDLEKIKRDAMTNTDL